VKVDVDYRFIDLSTKVYVHRDGVARIKQTIDRNAGESCANGAPRSCGFDTLGPSSPLIRGRSRTGGGKAETGALQGNDSALRPNGEGKCRLPSVYLQVLLHLKVESPQIARILVLYPMNGAHTFVCHPVQTPQTRGSWSHRPVQPYKKGDESARALCADGWGCLAYNTLISIMCPTSQG
jgi:hypothetical protein